ncbi:MULTISPECIES: sugar MFS transporter [unclassified Chitinophaga]|uniref:sugar MFS transporter n=1 Tax=unclassified Chitinophaga TaxID=2619133 RepID=UPI00117ECA09|nr:MULTISPECIES: sugar MFS transporter [unclassified Chitinophaga]WPV66838.1 sugar MFS transporter [Chitinophaga sp. LS1]
MGNSATSIKEPLPMQPQQQANYGKAMGIIGTLFFIFGFVTWLNSVLIPFLKQACEISDFEVFFVTFAFYISYLVMAIPSSAILKKIGFTKGMSLGLLIMAVGSLIFIPAAYARSFPLFLLGLFAQGTGLTLLQAASNPYVTILGPIEKAAQRISIMGICNKVAGMIGIFVLVQLLFSDATELSAKINTLTGAAREAELQALAQRVVVPYLVMTVVLLALAFMVRKSELPEINTEEEDTAADEAGVKKGIPPHLLLGVVCIFAYVGVEVLAIDSLALYGEYSGLEKMVATNLGIYSLIALTIGYLSGIVLIPKVISQKTGLIICASLALILSIGALATHGWTSIICIILLSLSHALMWPGIWPLAMNKAGKYTKIGAAFMVMAICGGAILPLIYGAIAKGSDRHIAYVVMLPCYLYILYYGLSGHKVGLKKA